MGLSTNAHASDRLPAAGHPTVRAAVESLLLEERTRWAMQYHDGLTQSVTSAVLELQTLRHRIEDDPSEAIATLKVIEDEIRSDLQRIRELLFEMTSAEPDAAAPALVALVRDAMDRWHMSTTVEVDGNVDRATDEVLEAAYAIVAEGLANAAKHSGAVEAAVRVHAGEARYAVEIEDRGRGIAAVDDDDPHFGLTDDARSCRSTRRSARSRIDPRARHAVIAVLPVGGRGE